MEYPRGKGGIVLCNLLFKDNEELPVNGVKKRSVLASLLRNLGAPFGGGRPIIAGANLAYAPVPIDKHANQFRTEAGWFGDARFTLKDLPTGEQTFAGVKYDIYDFRTSPGADVHHARRRRTFPTIRPRRCGDPGGPQGRRPVLPAHRPHRSADAEDERKKGKRYEMLRYVIHYADGKEENVPILSEIDIGDYQDEDAAAAAARATGLDAALRGHGVPRGGIFKAMEQSAARRGDPVDRHGLRPRQVRRAGAVGRHRRDVGKVRPANTPTGT